MYALTSAFDHLGAVLVHPCSMEQCLMYVTIEGYPEAIAKILFFFQTIAERETRIQEELAEQAKTKTRLDSRKVSGLVE